MVRMTLAETHVEPLCKWTDEGSRTVLTLTRPAFIENKGADQGRFLLRGFFEGLRQCFDLRTERGADHCGTFNNSSIVESAWDTISFL